MGFSDSAVIVICIVLAGVLVLIGWAIGHRVWQGRNPDDPEGGGAQVEQNFSQYEYMRDLRERTKENIAASNTGRPQKMPRQQSFPMTATDFSSGPSHY